MRLPLLLPLLAAAIVLANTPARADSYAEACAFKQGLPVAQCTCEGGIATKVLKPGEMALTIAILRGNAAKIKVLAAKFSQAQIDALSAKMDVIGKRTDAQCSK